MNDLTYDTAFPYTTIARKDGKPLQLWGTDYTVPAANISEERNEASFVYYATNESGTLSYGEATYDEVYVV